MNRNLNFDYDGDGGGSNEWVESAVQWSRFLEKFCLIEAYNIIMVAMVVNPGWN